jgi:hypothetical protein
VCITITPKRVRMFLWQNSEDGHDRGIIDFRAILHTQRNKLIIVGKIRLYIQYNSGS